MRYWMVEAGTRLQVQIGVDHTSSRVISRPRIRKPPSMGQLSTNSWVSELIGEPDCSLRDHSPDVSPVTTMITGVAESGGS
jgi:hypothetical protein